MGYTPVYPPWVRILSCDFGKLLDKNNFEKAKVQFLTYKMIYSIAQRAIVNTLLLSRATIFIHGTCRIYIITSNLPISIKCHDICYVVETNKHQSYILSIHSVSIGNATMRGVWCNTTINRFVS